MMRTARFGLNISSFNGIKRNPINLYHSTSTSNRSCFHASNRSCFHASNRFIFKRFITNQRQTVPSQDKDEETKDKPLSNKPLSSKRLRNKQMRNKQLRKKLNIVTMGPIASQTQTPGSQTDALNDNKHQLDVSPSWSTRLARSYVLPFTVMSGTFGCALTYATDNPVFILCTIPLGICGGMIRDKNANMQNDKYLSTGIKLVSIYVLGPPILMCGVGLIGLMAFKDWSSIVLK
jgi:hypothetical protein